MRKINSNLENPIDDLLISFAQTLNPFWKNMCMTPNMLTTLSLIFGVLSVYSLWTSNVTMFVVLYILSYFFDVADGDYAREYKMTSEFGDMYDHLKDVIVLIILVVSVYYRNINKHSPKTIITNMIILCIFGVLMLSHLGCQEKIYNKNESMSLKHCTYLCPSTESIKITKYFGCGTFVMVFLSIIVYLEKNRNEL